MTVSLLALSVAACGGSGTATPDGAEPPARQDPAGADGGAEGGERPQAEGVGATPPNEDLNEKLGIFVSPSGTDNAEGTRANPLARIQPAIDLGKKVGKRVYVCTGVYREALVIADTISIIGGLDCSNPEAWKTSPTTYSRVEAPTSPALLAKDIGSPTRLEGLDIVAPNATAPSASSIGLLADHAGGVVVARSKITSGDAMKGDDGAEGTQLANGPNTMGGRIPDAYRCGDVNPCPFGLFGPPVVAGAAGGTNTCQGAGGHVGLPGGSGGTGGLYEVKEVQAPLGGKIPRFFVYDRGNGLDAAAQPAAPGFTGAPGADGTDGPAAPAVGILSKSGYVPADGTNGTLGVGGFGGSGGRGQSPDVAIYKPTPVGSLWHGWGGGGGGAGGCPGLAGTGGKGGGASMAAALIESPLKLDGVQLSAGRGGDGGKGTLGSLPTAGGIPNNPEVPSTLPGLIPNLGKPGGRGGAAGVSSNGSSGPSVAVGHVGQGPIIVGDSTMKPGAGGAAIEARTRTEAGITSTITATPAGASKDILPL